MTTFNAHTSTMNSPSYVEIVEFASYMVENRHFDADEVVSFLEKPYNWTREIEAMDEIKAAEAAIAPKDKQALVMLEAIAVHLLVESDEGVGDFHYHHYDDGDYGTYHIKWSNGYTWVHEDYDGPGDPRCGQELTLENVIHGVLHAEEMQNG